MYIIIAIPIVASIRRLDAISKINPFVIFSDKGICTMSINKVFY